MIISRSRVLDIFVFLKILIFAPDCIPMFLETAGSFRSCFYNVLDGIMEKAMATHSSTLTWKIPWMEEPGRLQSMGLLRVGHD